MARNGYDEDGVYTIFIGKQQREALAYCKQKILGGGWQVIQQRMLQLAYQRPLMADYVRGFGRADGDFWIGLETMAEITSIPHELLITIRDKYGKEMMVHYAFVQINKSDLDYSISIGEKLSGDLPDEFSPLNNQKFTAFDHERLSNCDDSGWWHTEPCSTHANFNIQMGEGNPRVVYPNIKGYDTEFEVAEAAMLIRPIRKSTKNTSE